MAGDPFQKGIGVFRQVLSAVGGLVASVGLMFWTIQKEVKRKKSSSDETLGWALSGSLVV